MFATNSLATQWPEFADIADVASGVLAISISQLHPSVWKEQVRLQAEDWTRAEIDTVGDFRTAIVNFVLR